MVPNRKRINGNLFRKYRGTKVPRHQTLKNVFENLLDDVLFPAVVVGKRIRYPKSKAKVYKVFVDQTDRDSVEYKINSIIAAYKAMTNRELKVDFA